MKRFGPAFLAAAWASSAACGDPPPAAVPPGIYHGELWSNSMRTAETEFYAVSRDGQDGAYRFESGDEWETGSLAQCAPVAEREFRCRWTDAYGSGDLDLKFSPTLDAFEGVWSDEINERSLGLRWNGRKRQ